MPCETPLGAFATLARGIETDVEQTSTGSVTRGESESESTKWELVPGALFHLLIV